MATAHQVQAAIVSQINSVLTGSSVPFQIGIGWPPQYKIQSITQSGAGLITVYDGKGSKDSTRWVSSQLSSMVTAAGIAATLSNGMVAPGTSITLNLSGVIVAGDALGVQF